MHPGWFSWPCVLIWPYVCCLGPKYPCVLCMPQLILMATCSTLGHSFAICCLGLKIHVRITQCQANPRCLWSYLGERLDWAYRTLQEKPWFVEKSLVTITNLVKLMTNTLSPLVVATNIEYLWQKIYFAISVNHEVLWHNLSFANWVINSNNGAATFLLSMVI